MYKFLYPISFAILYPISFAIMINFQLWYGGQLFWLGAAQLGLMIQDGLTG